MSAIASTAARHPDTELDRLLAELAAYRSCDPPRLSLPPRAFTSPELYELERARVFGRSWMLVVHRDELASPGDYVSLTIAGEPVVVTRGEGGALHAMSPVCRHRLMPLVEPGHGRADAFTCPYHLWKYRLDGRLKGATFMKGNPDFDPAACRLPGFAVEEWQGLVYVNLDAGAPSLASRLAPAAEELAPFRMDEMVQVATVEEEWRVNWKLALENGYENYHVMGFHPETLDPFMPGRGDMELHPIDGGALWARTPFAATLPPGAVPLPREHRANATVVLTFPPEG
ncbi:hypothetical protein GCM10009678_90220 [Actinomadura kijaniata]|uniref:Phenylpropionate dioxygenase-like ring-hydroxylating dioxygenase large terminal subunit n=1 Tax=Actinomadura namibiensis TaxID=182080 RepID=A0A7W3LT25_ACTNM|nr:phenylpropionate dioxygenase-like ring-hydroxylating dioxygenase large terminal subunit [Actinomadura namibiensis]